MIKLKTLFYSNQQSLLEVFYNKVFDTLSSSKEKENDFLKMFLQSYENETEIEGLEDLEDISYDLPDFEGIKDIYYKDIDLRYDYEKNIRLYNPKNILKIFKLIEYETFLSDMQEVKGNLSFQLMAYNLLVASPNKEVVIHIGVKNTVIPKDIKKKVLNTNLEILGLDKLPIKSMLLQKYATELKFLNINTFPIIIHLTEKDMNLYPLIPIVKKL
jgi:hypothetical protein